MSRKQPRRAPRRRPPLDRCLRLAEALEKPRDLELTRTKGGQAVRLRVHPGDVQVVHLRSP